MSSLKGVYKCLARGRWTPSLEMFSKVECRYNPMGRSSVAVREFLRHCDGRTLRATNTRCEILERQVNGEGEASSVMLTFNSGAEHVVSTEGLDKAGLYERVGLICQMEMLRELGITAESYKRDVEAIAKNRAEREAAGETLVIDKATK